MGIAHRKRVKNSEFEKSVLLIPPKIPDSHIRKRAIHQFGSFGIDLFTLNWKERRLKLRGIEAPFVAFKRKQLLSLVVSCMDKSTKEALLRLSNRVRLSALADGRKANGWMIGAQ